jgi:MSHA biogenesis protein MshG
MQRFQYKAKKGPSDIVDGHIYAENSQAAVEKIIKMGLTPIDVGVEKDLDESSRKKRSSISLNSFRFVKKVSFNDLVAFTRQISDLVDASVSILKSLQAISEQTKNTHFKEIILDMHEVVKDGGAFSDALAQNVEIFSPLYINMVKTGESGGNLSVVLQRLAVYLEKEQDTRGKIRSSLAYPSLVLIVGFITIFTLNLIIVNMSNKKEGMLNSIPSYIFKV